AVGWGRRAGAAGGGAGRRSRGPSGGRRWSWGCRLATPTRRWSRPTRGRWGRGWGRGGGSRWGGGGACAGVAGLRGGRGAAGRGIAPGRAAGALRLCATGLAAAPLPDPVRGRARLGRDGQRWAAVHRPDPGRP